jgi:chorismate--pyruvate lyase
MFENFLPLSLKADWRNEPHTLISDHLSQWLFEQGSLTQRLKRHSDHFRVEILGKHERLFTELELQQFDCPQQQIQVREVLLHCDGKPWVYAQTLMPLEVIPESVQKLITLGEKPLGEIIFNEPGVVRSAIEVAEFGVDTQVAKLAAKLGQAVTNNLWGRRSIFTVDGYSLLVAEVYIHSSKVYS